MLTASSTASVTSCFSVLMSRSEGTVAFIDRLYTCMTRERQGTVQVHVEQCRPYIKIASITSYGAVAQCKSIGVNCWGTHTIRFYNWIPINLIYISWIDVREKVIVMSQSHQRVDWNLDVYQICNQLFRLCFRTRWSSCKILNKTESNKKIGWKIALCDCTLSQ